MWEFLFWCHWWVFFVAILNPNCVIMFAIELLQHDMRSNLDLKHYMRLFVTERIADTLGSNKLFSRHFYLQC